jgi:hypothetical protein
MRCHTDFPRPRHHLDCDSVKITRGTFSAVITGLAIVILVAAIPSAVRDTFETGRVYLFSAQFFEELPQRLTGPGRFRFVLQPLVAIFLGWRSGLSDARAGLPPFLYVLLSRGADRKKVLRSGLAAVRDLVAIAIVLDAVSQLLIYRQVHPGAALILGPVLISVPYALARALTGRVLRITQRDSG